MSIFFIQYVFPYILFIFILTIILFIKIHMKIAIIFSSIMIFILIVVLGYIFVPKMIRGKKLINEINNFYYINNEYPKFHSLNDEDREKLLYIYKKAFPNEDVQIGGFNKLYTQPYYEERNFTPNYYRIYYKIGWSNLNVWDWIFIYDSSENSWSISFMQY